MTQLTRKPTKGPRCSDTNRRGEPCGMPPLQGTDRCFNHSPTRARDRAKARKRGGRQRRAPLLFPPPTGPTPLRDVASIQAVLEQITSETLLLGNTVQRSRAIAGLLLVGLKCLEVGSLEERLAALEALTGPRRVA
jgi:hypothetical protein